MIWIAAVALLVAAGDKPPNAGQPVTLDAGDFRWVDVTVRQTPAEVDCSYQVVRGDGSVHVELLPKGELRAFSRGRDHDTMAMTPDGSDGEFRRIVDQPGHYVVVLENAPRARPATVLLDVKTNFNPGADVARTLPAARRVTVIAISFAVFFATVAWSGRRLLRAMQL